MEIKILSKETKTIKPSFSSSTQKHPTTFNLTVLDQISPQFYMPIILFYSPVHKITISETSHHLQKSFSETLARFYPLAGRMRDDWTCVDCNDDGAVFVEARVAGDMSSVALSQQTTEGLQNLLPLNPHGEIPDELSSQVIVAVQVNHFDCGGIAIAVCIWHEVADASTIANFIKIWAEIARGHRSEENVDDLVIDNTSIFIPQDMTAPMAPKFVKKPALVTDSLTMKKFLFPSSKISSLQKQATSTDLGRPTRFEALSALLWGAFAAISSGEGQDNTVSGVNLLIALDLRKRLNPQLPGCSIGNISQSVPTLWPLNSVSADSKLTEYYNLLAERIRETMKALTDEHIRKFHGGGGLYKFLMEVGRNKREEGEEGKKKNKMFGMTSLCRFPFYESDFGWGNPVCVSPALRLHNACVLMDARDGDGIEAWVALSKEDMEKFLQNPEIVAYASFSSTA